MKYSIGDTVWVDDAHYSGYVGPARIAREEQINLFPQWLCFVQIPFEVDFLSNKKIQNQDKFFVLLDNLRGV
jgi:hypothetical protein